MSADALFISISNAELMLSPPIRTNPRLLHSGMTKQRSALRLSLHNAQATFAAAWTIASHPQLTPEITRGRSAPFSAVAIRFANAVIASGMPAGFGGSLL